MRAAMLALANAVTLFAAADEPKEAPEAKDLKVLSGKWLVEALSTEGEAVPKKLFAGSSVTIKDGKYILDRADDTKPVQWKLTLETAKKPKRINLKPLDKKAPARMGIYELKGDTLRIAMCGVKRKAGRPKSFKPDLGVNVVTFKRVKAKK
jgi:uncharacterized protein (TIGR03067 family)